MIACYHCHHNVTYYHDILSRTITQLTTAGYVTDIKLSEYSCELVGVGVCTYVCLPVCSQLSKLYYANAYLRHDCCIECVLTQHKLMAFSY